MLGDTNAAGGAAANKFLQQRFPSFEWTALQVFAVEAEEIEDEVDERASASATCRVLQRLKAGSAVGQHDGCLSVNQRIVESECADRVCDFGKGGGPVVAVARVERHASFADARTDSLVVVLNLVEPLVA